MEIDLEDQSRGGGDHMSLATSFLPSENQRLCSLLNRIEGHLTQMKERPHKQEDRDIDPSLVQVMEQINSIQLWGPSPQIYTVSHVWTFEFQFFSSFGYATFQHKSQ